MMYSRGPANTMALLMTVAILGMVWALCRWIIAWVGQRIKDSAAITMDGLRDDLKKIREELDRIRRNLAIESA